MCVDSTGGLVTSHIAEVESFDGKSPLLAYTMNRGGCSGGYGSLEQRQLF